MEKGEMNTTLGVLPGNQIRVSTETNMNYYNRDSVGNLRFPQRPRFVRCDAEDICKTACS